MIDVLCANVEMDDEEWLSWDIEYQGYNILCNETYTSDKYYIFRKRWSASFSFVQRYLSQLREKLTNPNERLTNAKRHKGSVW